MRISVLINDFKFSLSCRKNSVQINHICNKYKIK